MITLVIATDFSKTPGLRYKGQSKFSGEAFRENVLEPAFLKAIKQNTDLVINLDGTEGLTPSFLEESFGGLARLHGITEVQNKIKYIAKEEPYLIDEIKEYVQKANGEA